MSRTIELTVKPGGVLTLLRDGKPPGLERHYFVPQGDSRTWPKYVAYYWRPDEPVWISQGEQCRLADLARRKRKPFVVQVEVVDPVPGAQWGGQSVNAAWALECLDPLTGELAVRAS
jgi:hypothetical protein